MTRTSRADRAGSTEAASRAVGISMLLELTSTLLAAAVWIIGVTIT